MAAIAALYSHVKTPKCGTPFWARPGATLVGALLVGLLLVPVSSASAGPRSLSLEDRIEAQRAIEQVFWSHRIWPRENKTAKPVLSAVMSDAAIRAKVEGYLVKGMVLTTEQLQAELNRIASHTRDPLVLKELFDALGNDPFLIAETLVRQTLVDRLIGNDSKGSTTIDRTSSGPFVLPAVTASECVDDVWSATFRGVPPTSNGHTAVWTGTEMIVWGGERIPQVGGLQNAGGRYTPSTDSWEPTSTGTNVPSARSAHTAVWTGTVMVIWGGYNGSTVVNTGGRYDPSTDTWLVTSTGMSVAAARSNHTAVWTGTRIVVWGGSGTGGNLNTGGRYDPIMDTWQTTSTGLNVPSIRHAHTAVWTENVMIVWGGFNAINMSLNTGGRYDPSADTWLATSTGMNVPAGRDGHSAVWTGTEMIVWGGESDAFATTLYNTGGRYNPSNDTWAQTSIGANVPAPRRFHSGVWTGTEMIVWGGLLGFTDGGRYNPAMDTWATTSTANVPEERDKHTAVWTGTEMIVWGGRNPSAVHLNSGGRYDPSMNTWAATSTAGAPEPRYFHTSVWTGTEMIVWGGFNGSSQLNTGSRYTPSTDSWTETSTSGPDARYLHTAVWDGTTMIVWGGLGSSNDAKNTGGRYMPSMDTWDATSTGTDVPVPRFSHTAVWTGTQMIVWGGRNAGFATINTGGLYNASGNSWAPTSTGTDVPDPRRRHTAVWTGTEMIIWGGTNDAVDFNTGGRYEPTGNAWVATSTGTNSPTARQMHTAVWTGTEMIIWGGSVANAPVNSGGRYDPSNNTWGTPTSTGTNVPPGSMRATAIWTDDEMIVWGGMLDLGGNGTVKTGGRYDPSMDTWAATSLGTDVPDSRFAHTAVWTGSQMIIWGGTQGNSPINTGGKYCRSTTDVPAGPTGTGLALLGAWPNPSHGRVLSVRFSLASQAPAVLECFDVAGRRVASTTLSNVGSGVHVTSVRLRATTPPGVYLVRLKQGQERRSVRVALLD